MTRTPRPLPHGPPHDSPPRPEPLPPLGLSLRRLALRVLLVGVAAYGLHLVSTELLRMADALPPGSRGMARIGLLATLLAALALMMAAPFLPGVEIALTLMMMRGAEVAPFVYVATVAGLLLAYLLGRYLSQDVLWRLLCDLRLARAAALVRQMQPLDAAQRLALLHARLPGWLGPVVVRWRYPMLGVLLNLPGNALIGGGGGICLMAGLSRMFSTPGVLLTLLVAVAPVPLFVWTFGMPAWLS